MIRVRRRRRGRIGTYTGGAPTAGSAWRPAHRPRTGRARSDDRLAARLRAAGRSPADAERLRVRQLAQAGAGVAAGLVTGALLVGSAPFALLLAGVGGLLGITRAPAALAREAEARRARMRLELVTVDQVLAIHVRAGAGPVQAVTRLVARGRGAVVDELRGVLAAVRSGRSEAEAFRLAAATTAEPHAARTYRLFALAAEQGADLGTALRALSADLRIVRRDELRRRATRRRAAMLVPTIAVLAPVMLGFVIAPLPSLVLGR
ncbi:MAG: type II secretion system F family protein [Actinomycetota bacterium]